MADNGLSKKQEAFLEAYLQTWNATKAAKIAGYSEKTAYSSGQRLLKSVEIASRVRARLSEMAMETNEVLARLASHARGDAGDLLDSSTMTLDLKKAIEQGNTQLIKKIKQTVITSDDKQTEIFEFELYDAQAALVHIGKHLGMFGNKLDITSGGEKLEIIIRNADTND
jgi:phage terminase small subunit